MTVSEASAMAIAIAAPLPADHSDDVNWGRMGRDLVFVDQDLEAGFRAAERNRNLSQARFVIWLALAVEVVFAATGPWLLPDGGLAVVLICSVPLTLFLLLLLRLTHAAYFRTRWPMLMTAGVYGLTLAAGLTNVLIEVPTLYLSGFMLLVLSAYLVIPLIFTYCISTVLVASLVYLAITAFSDAVDGELLGTIAAQLVAANAVGIAALRRAERLRRLDYLRDRRLDQQRARYHDLLTSILPAPVADRLERGESVVDEYADATVLFADIVGFTALAARCRADEILDLLNRLFASFDTLTAQYGLEKIKTIGDSYMVAGGVTGRGRPHLPAMADLALAMQRAAAQIRDPDGRPVHLRIGIHVGGLTAGVIGRRRFMYDLWGDTVNIASRMQTLGEPDRIQISDDLRQRLDSRYEIAPRGEIEVKGKGAMATWYLLGRKDEAADEEDFVEKEA